MPIVDQNSAQGCSVPPQALPKFEVRKVYAVIVASATEST